MINEEWVILAGKGEGNKFYHVDWQITFTYEGDETVARCNTKLHTPLPRSASEADLMAGVKESLIPQEIDDWRQFANDYLIGETEGVYYRSAAGLEQDVKEKRLMFLHKSDWVAIRAQETGEAIPEEWATYRQALRDITDQAGYPENVVWPTKP